MTHDHDTHDHGSDHGPEVIESGVHTIKAWTRGVPVDPGALRQLQNTARLPIVHGWVAAMPDVHWGIGATVGSVIPTLKAIIPAAVGVDIGCGMMAARLSISAEHLPDDLFPIRRAIEKVVPLGHNHHRRVSASGEKAWKTLAGGYRRIVELSPRLEKAKRAEQLGTLGGGNHFIEVCLDTDERVWVMLHSGSRGVGNKIGQHFISQARKEMKEHIADLPDKDLAYFEEGNESFDDYVHAVTWAQRYARLNRELMMENILRALADKTKLPEFQVDGEVVNCHHNYVQKELHFGEEVFVTRKGALRAGKGEMGIIPGSMGARSFIVRGLGNPESFESCSHGAGRVMSRTQARRQFSVQDHIRATEGIECRKDGGVIDETPMAYKDIDAVMAAQRDLVEVAHQLRQVVCVKG